MTASNTSRSTGRTHRVLIIDDDPLCAISLVPYFKTQGFDVRSSLNAEAGLADALANLPSLILLAVSLPDKPGLAVFKELRNRPRTAHIPIMFLAEHIETRHQNELLSAGADDFITKPFDLDILGLRVRNAIKRVERDGVNDPRTGLPTGKLVQERIRALADELGWYKIDLAIDNFDAFHNLYGFMTAEEVIAFAARMVNESVQQMGTPDDFIGQRGDTEFVVITRLDKGPVLRDYLTSHFNEEVLSFYSFVEREQGYVEVDDGSGGRVRKPLMSAKTKVQEGEADD